jgi:drug/metabolite transporter (DMT)-like permease
LRVTAVTMGVAAVVLAAGTALTGSGFGGLAWRPVVAVVFLGVFCSGLAYYCWVKAVEETGPASAGAVLYFEPFVTLVIAVIVLSEPVGLATLTGGACVLLGVRLVSRGSRRGERV